MYHVYVRGEVHTEFSWGNLRKGDHLKDPDVDGGIILKRIFKKWDGRHGLDRSGSEQGNLAGSCECGNEPSGLIKCGEFID
jgi:hypothetical protein